VVTRQCDQPSRPDRPDRPNRPNRPGRAGFTLLEVLMAVAVLSIAMVAVIKAGLLSQDGLIRSADAQQAMALALEKLDEVEAAGPNQWSILNGDFRDKDMAGWRWELTISPTTLEALYLVEVSVAQDQDGSQPARAIRLEKLLWRR